MIVATLQKSQSHPCKKQLCKNPPKEKATLINFDKIEYTIEFKTIYIWLIYEYFFVINLNICRELHIIPITMTQIIKTFCRFNWFASMNVQIAF